MNWNYAVGEKEGHFHVIEVYEEDGRLGWTDEVAPCGATATELVEDLLNMLEDIDHYPVFDTVKGEYMPTKKKPFWKRLSGQHRDFAKELMDEFPKQTKGLSWREVARKWEDYSETLMAGWMVPNKESVNKVFKKKRKK